MKPRCPPGPVATSCLTCKRRRKKCDRSRPACERCAQDKQDCLGYDHIQERPSASGSTWSSKYGVTIQEIGFPTQPSPLEGSQSESQNDEPSMEQGLETEAGNSLILPDAPTAISTLPAFNFATSDRSRYVDLDVPTDLTITSTPTSSSGLSVLESDQLLGVDTLPTIYSSLGQFGSQPDAITAPNSAYIYPIPVSLVEVSVPRMLSADSQSSDKLIIFVLSQYKRFFTITHLTEKHQQTARMRDQLIHRLRGSSIARCAMFIGAKMLESRLDGTTSHHHGDFSKPIEQFEQKLLLVSASSQCNPQEYLNGSLEVTFLKMQLAFTRQLLSRAATVFLKIVYSDPMLQPNPYGPVSVSLDRIFSSSNPGLGRFAMLDITCAMAYGTPQLVDYDTSASTIRPSDHPIEWVQGCPSEFLLCIAEINRRYSNGYIAHDWHLIERRIRSFESHPVDAQGVDPCRAIARVAIVESWRQTLLIYLYMAVCGLASDDHRVQSAVHQLFQLFKAVRRQKSPKPNMRLVFQCLLAGVCTRNEKQRAYVRDRLSDSNDNKLWLLPGSEFVPVLDYLWHGAAANGKPVTWSDYIIARQAALPIPL